MNPGDRPGETAQQYLQRTGGLRLFETLTTRLLLDRPEKPTEYLIGCLGEMSANRYPSETVTRGSLLAKHRSFFLTDEQIKPKGDTDSASDCRGGASDGPSTRLTSWPAILRGCLEDLPPLPSNIVRVFLSSTFSDFKAERTVLPRTAYPQLQQFCSQRGLDFQVVDMRWGVTDEMVNDHMTSAICLREITLCQELSQGPCFVAMLGQRYGYQPLPSVIEAREFEVLHQMAASQRLANVKVLDSWYIRDDNALPPVYCLQSIPDNLPHYNNMDPDQHHLQQKAKATWATIYRQLQTLLRKSAQLAVDDGLLGEERKRSYFMSVTEEEIQQGILLTSSLVDSALCYVRELEGIKNVPFTNAIVTRYLDVLEECHLDETAQELLADLVHDKLPTKLTQDHFKAYTTKWTGIPLETLQEKVHQNYLDRFCADFVKDVQTMVAERRARPGQDLPYRDRHLYLEVLQHSKFCLKKCEVFCGQEDTIRKVKGYIGSLGNVGQHLPLIIHGRSGYGKTSLLANIAKLASREMDSIETVVVRFLGTSPGSSSIKSSLTSLTKQLCLVYGLDTAPLDTLNRMSDVRREFTHVLEIVSQSLQNDRKLLIILDSIDQLSTSFGSQQMHWLPRSLPNNVGMILSMLTDRYTCYTAAKQRLRNPDAFIELTEMPAATGKEIIKQYLINHNRRITSYQQCLIMKAFGVCQQPLFLKLLLDEARQWKSYTHPCDLDLLTSVQAAINQLFQKLEEKFGRVFVQGALGYLTCGKDGLTGIELEDVLSCDDEVLNEVYAFHDPPLPDVVRLPPLLWARLQYEIKEYLVERTADGKTVMAWYHRLFWETATDRFVEPRARNVYLHGKLGEIFRCEDSVKSDIVLEKRNNLTMDKADRQVTPQPLTVRNVRKLNSLPYHLFHSEQYEELKTRCLLDFRWIFTKIQAVSVTELANDYELFCSREPLASDRDVCLVQDFLQLAYEPLKEDPSQLAYQVIERLGPLINRYSSLAAFVGNAREWTGTADIPLLIPVQNTNMKSPESALKYSFLAGNTGIISKTGEVAVCGFLDKLSGKFKVNIWNLNSKDTVESIPSKPKHPFVISGDSTVLAVVGEDVLSVYDTCSGDLLQQFRYRQEKFQKCDIKSVCLDNKGRFLIIGAKLGEKAKGSGIRYRSDLHVVDIHQCAVTRVEQYSKPGSRSLEHMMLVPGDEKLVVIDYGKITVYDTQTLTVCRMFDRFSEIKADTFCFASSGHTLYGTFGGYNSLSSKVLVLDINTGDVRVSDVLFQPVLPYEEPLSAQPSDDESESECDSDEEQNLVIARAFSLIPNDTGSLLLVGLSSVGTNRQNCIAVWHRQNGHIQRLELPERKERFPKCLVVFPDWTSVVVGWDDGLMMFVNLSRMAVVREMKAHEMSVNVMQMVPERRHLISIGTDRKLKIWDIDHLKAEISAAQRTAQTQCQVKQVCLDEQEQVVDYCCVDSEAVTALPFPTSPPKLWSITTAEPCADKNACLEQTYYKLYPEKSDIRKDVSLTYLQNGRYLVDVRRRRAEAVAHIIDVANGGLMVNHFATFNPHVILDERFFLSVTFGELLVRELPSGVLCRHVKMSPWPEELVQEHINTPPQIAVTTDKKYFVFVNLTGCEKYVEVVDLESFSVISKSDIPDISRTGLFQSTGFTYLLLQNTHKAMLSSPESVDTSGFTDATYRGVLGSKMVSPSGLLGITLQNSPNTLTMWSTKQAIRLYQTDNLPQKIHCVCFSPNERYLLTGSYNIVSVWSTEGGTTLSRIHTYGAVCSLSFTPSGTHALIHCYAAPKRKRLIICRALHMT